MDPAQVAQIAQMGLDLFVLFPLLSLQSLVVDHTLPRLSFKVPCPYAIDDGGPSLTMVRSIITMQRQQFWSTTTC